MKKIILLLLILGVSNTFANQLINHIEAVKYGQFYCIKGSESPELTSFLKDNAKYAYNECKHEKYNQKDFQEIEELANKDPKEYGYYLGMAYYLGWTPDLKINDSQAKEWFKKSGDLGNTDSQIKYCNLTTIKPDRINCYDKLTSPDSYFARAIYIYNNNEKEKYKYTKKAALSGSIEAYPAYISNEMSLNENFNYNDAVKNKLKSVISNTDTSFATKLISAGILNNEKDIYLLSKLLQPSNFKYS